MSRKFECFEWDEAKRLTNIAKHGIDFRDAVGIFAGRFFAKVSPRRGEERWEAIGTIDGRVVTVAYTWRGEVCRMISARPADRRERLEYQDQLE